MRKIAIIVIFALLFNVAGCLIAPTPIDPKPQKLFDFPDWIREPQHIRMYLLQVGAQYESDKNTTGYNSYYFTPAELVMRAIPDAKRPGRTIYKQPWHGDCDDWALMTAYLAQEALGYQAHYVHIYPKNGERPGHALSYAIAPDGKVHVFNLWYYHGAFASFDDYMQRYYPDQKVTLDVPVWERINELVAQGHVLYYTEEYEDKRKAQRNSCQGNFCAVW